MTRTTTTTLVLLESYAVVPFFLMFLSIYLAGHLIIFRNWSPKIRPESASCLISLLHGTPATILASAAIAADPHRGFSAANTRFQNLVLDYSTAYFLTDILHYLVFFPNDALFIAHHLATLFVIVTCRHVASHGAFAVLSLLVLAEVTSACQNAWTLAGVRRREDGFAARLYDALCPPFYAVYSVVRGFVGPYFVYEMVVFYARGFGDGVVPRWVWVSWVGVVVVAIGVSILWIWNRWVELFSERRRRRLDKGSKVF